MKVLAFRKLIGDINAKKLLGVIMLLSFLVVCSCNKKLNTNEIKTTSSREKVIPKQKGTIKQNYTSRVVVVVVQTHATEGWCRLMLSAIMNKIEIVTIALGALYSHEKRPGWIMECIENEMLKDEDIIISVDGSDTIVTERENFDRSVQYFINKSAPSESSFKSDDVIKGKQISPVIFLADPHCYAPQLDVIIDSMHKEHEARCHWFYKYAYDFAEKHSLASLMIRSKNGHNFLSAGAFISRVWAFKKAHKAYETLLATSNKWWCDQSIWVLVFIRSVTQTNVSSDFNALPVGFIALDYESEFFHYPFYIGNSKATFLHFTGDPMAWRARTPTIISHLSWYKSLSQDNQKIFFQNKALETNLELHAFNNKKQNVRFEKICGNKLVGNNGKVCLTEK